MKISQKALEMIRNSSRVKARLMLALNRGNQMIEIYIKTNNQMLTMASALKIIREETGLAEEEILVEETEKV